MTQIKLNLRVNAVDNITPINNVFFVFNLKNNLNRIEIIYENTDPIIEFIIKESAGIKVEDSERDLLMRIIPISCSLTSLNAGFSTNDHSGVSKISIYNSTENKIHNSEINISEEILIEENDQNEVFEENKGETVIRLQSIKSTEQVNDLQLFVKEEIIFDVPKFLRIFKVLYKMEIFESKSTIPEQNFVESLHEYELAINSQENYECFKHLFCSLEKIVNMKKEYFRDNFDIKVSNLTGINELDAKHLRNCYNRMKHCSRNPDHVEELEKCFKELRFSIRKLKKIVDKSIFLRITLFNLYSK